MSSPPSPRDLDGLIAEEWGQGALDRPDVMAVLEPYRERVDYLMDDFDEETQSWRDYCACIWGYGRKAGPSMEGAIPYDVQERVADLLKEPAPRAVPRGPFNPDAPSPVPIKCELCERLTTTGLCGNCAQEIEEGP